MDLETVREILKDYVPYKGPTYRGFINRDFYNDAFLKEILKLDDLIRNETPLRERGGSRTFRLRLNASDGENHIFLKVKEPRNVLSAFTDPMSPLLSHRRNLIHYSAYAGSGFRTPKVIAIFESNNFYRRYRYTLSAEAEDSVTLRKYLEGVNSNGDSVKRDKYERILRNVSRLAKRLHDNGIFHLDLNDTNVLVEGGSGNNLTLVDLEHTIIVGRYSKHLSGFLRFIDFIGVNVWIAELISPREIEKFYYWYNKGDTDGKVPVSRIKYFSKHPFLYKKNTFTKKIFSWSIGLIRMALYLFRGY